MKLGKQGLIDRNDFYWRPLTKELFVAQRLEQIFKKNTTNHDVRVSFELRKPIQILKNGETLITGIDRVPQHLLRRPLLEPDPHYRYEDLTYVFIQENFTRNAKIIYRFSAEKSLYLFSPWSPIRQLCMTIMTSPLFSALILLTILVNCVILALDDISEHTESVTEIVFCVIYSIEMIIRLIAMGGYRRSHTYFRDGWNWLDFITVILTYITFAVPDVGGASSPKAFRVLRVQDVYYNTSKFFYQRWKF